MKTTQEIFDTVAVHLLTQRERALDRLGMCRFRNDKGLKCAVGCLIPDDQYTSDFENWGLQTLLDTARLYSPGGFPPPRQAGGFAPFGLGPEHFPLLSALQSMHDIQPAQEWLRTLSILAKALGLKDRVLEGLQAVPA